MLEKLFQKYWRIRIYNNYKKNTLKIFLNNIISFCKKNLLKKNIGEMPFKYFFIKRRKLIKKFCKENLIDIDNQNIKTYFNYYLDSSLINKKSVIYSFGLATNIKFEEHLVRAKGVGVYCYDPTPVSINYMKQINNPNIIYKPFGIWIEDKKMKFYSAHTESEKNWGGSILETYGTGGSREYLQCYKLKTLMNSNNHKKIDVLKLDIEGVATEVLNDIFNDKIFPQQIAVEFEVTEDDNINKNIFKSKSDDILKILNRMKLMGYKIYHMPRFSNLPYSSIEVLCIKK